MASKWRRCKEPHYISFFNRFGLLRGSLLAHFDVIHVGREIADYSPIIGFGLLLLAVRIKGL